MPTLSPVQQQLIDIFSSPQNIVNLAIIYNNCRSYKKDSFSRLWDDLCDITLGTPEVAQRLLQEFNPNDLDDFINYPRLSADQTVITSAALTEILKKIKNIIVQGKQQNQLLITARGNQKKAIELLWDEGFLSRTYEIFHHEHTFPQPVPQELLAQYQDFLQGLHAIATSSNAGQENNFLAITNNIAKNFKEYLEQLHDENGYNLTDPYFSKWLAFTLKLIFYFKDPKPSLISRLAGTFIALLVAPFLYIIFHNPIKSFLWKIATKDYLEGLLIMVFYPFIIPILVADFTISSGYQKGFDLTFKSFAGIIQADFRYSLLSFFIIGLGVASALTLVFFPPVMPFLLSLPMLSTLSGMSIPWLAVIAGTAVGLLATLIIGSITWLATRKTNIHSDAADFHDDKETPLIAATDQGQSQQAQAALAVTSKPLFVLTSLPKIMILDVTEGKDVFINENLSKQRSVNTNNFDIVKDENQITITCKTENITGKIEFHHLKNSIVIKNGQCNTSLPPYIRFIPYQPSLSQTAAAEPVPALQR